MKANSPFLFLVFDVLIQVTAVAATFLAPSGTWVLLLLGAGWQLFSYNTLYAWSNKSKYRKGYINVCLFTIGVLAVGALFLSIGLGITSHVLIIGMALMGGAAVLGALLYLVYFLITLSDLVYVIKSAKAKKNKKGSHNTGAHNWWV